MKMQSFEENYIYLEISVDKDLDEYKRVLCEASLLGIGRVFYACIWNDENAKGEKLINEIDKICKVLNIVSFSSEAGYASPSYDETMIGETIKGQYGVSPTFTKLIPMSEYKALKGIEVNEEQLKKKLANVMQ